MDKEALAEEVTRHILERLQQEQDTKPDSSETAPDNLSETPVAQSEALIAEDPEKSANPQDPDASDVQGAASEMTQHTSETDNVVSEPEHEMAASEEQPVTEDEPITMADKDQNNSDMLDEGVSDKGSPDLEQLRVTPEIPEAAATVEGEAEGESNESEGSAETHPEDALSMSEVSAGMSPEEELSEPEGSAETHTEVELSMSEESAGMSPEDELSVLEVSAEKSSEAEKPAPDEQDSALEVTQNTQKAENDSRSNLEYCAPEKGRLVITEEQAIAIEPGSLVSFPADTIITPLARDTLRERGVDYDMV